MKINFDADFKDVEEMGNKLFTRFEGWFDKIEKSGIFDKWIDKINVTSNTEVKNEIKEPEPCYEHIICPHCKKKMYFNKPSGKRGN